MPGTHFSICWIRGSRELRERYRRKHQENESQRLDEERPNAMGRWRRTCPPKGSLDFAMPASSLPSQAQCQWSSGTEARVPYTDKVTGRAGG